MIAPFRTIQNCRVCAKPYAAGAKDWVLINDSNHAGVASPLVRVHRFPMSFCPDCAFKTTVAQIPGLRKGAASA